MKTRRIIFLTTYLIIALGSVCAQPLKIDSLSTGFAEPLSQATIYGNGFSNSKVFFEHVEALVILETPTTILFKVPLGPSYGRIHVESQGLMASSNCFLSTRFYGTNDDNIQFYTNEMETSGVPKQVQFVAHGDFDGDGKVDIVVSSGEEKALAVFKNKTADVYNRSNLSASSFNTGVKLSIDTTPYTVYVSDLNNDGRPDILATAKRSNKVYLFENNTIQGTIDVASFKSVQTITLNSTDAIEVITADLNKDGKQDIVVTATASPLFSKLFVFKNNLSSSTIKASEFSDSIELITGTSDNGNGTFGVCASDLNGDGLDDLAVTTGSKGTYLFQNQSNTTTGQIEFGQPQGIITPKPSVFIATGDLNGDCLNDLVTTMEDSLILIQVNRGNISVLDSTKFQSIYTTALKYSGPSTINIAVKIAELNGDGKPDIVSTNWENSVNIIWNNIIDPSMVTATDFDRKKSIVMSNPFGLSVADFNRDGRSDILATYNVSTPFASGKIFLITNNSGFPLGVSTETQSDGISWSVYPNPANENLNIKLPTKQEGKSIVQLYSAEGRLEHTFESESYQISINIPSVTKAGYYYLVITTSLGKVYKQKLLLNR